MDLVLKILLLREVDTLLCNLPWVQWWCALCVCELVETLISWQQSRYTLGCGWVSSVQSMPVYCLFFSLRERCVAVVCGAHHCTALHCGHFTSLWPVKKDNTTSCW